MLEIIFSIVFSHANVVASYTSIVHSSGPKRWMHFGLDTHGLQDCSVQANNRLVFLEPEGSALGSVVARGQPRNQA